MEVLYGIITLVVILAPVVAIWLASDDMGKGR